MEPEPGGLGVVNKCKDGSGVGNGLDGQYKSSHTLAFVVGSTLMNMLTLKIPYGTERRKYLK
jgi:hypothetical protein